MARSTRRVILMKNMYTIWGRKRFLLSFPTLLSAEYSIPFYSTSNYQIPVSQREMEICKQAKLYAPPTRDLNILSSMQIVGVTGLSRLWAVKWAWQLFLEWAWQIFF